MEKIDKSVILGDIKAIIFVLAAIVIAVIWNYDDVFSQKEINEVKIVEEKK
jgi:hypothetical protein